MCGVWSCYHSIFFKQKPAYEMRISDWSSDVCSSDLEAVYANSHQCVCQFHTNQSRLPASETATQRRAPAASGYGARYREDYTASAALYYDVARTDLRFGQGRGLRLQQRNCWRSRCVRGLVWGCWQTIGRAQ